MKVEDYGGIGQVTHGILVPQGERTLTLYYVLPCWREIYIGDFLSQYPLESFGVTEMQPSVPTLCFYVLFFMEYLKVKKSVNAEENTSHISWSQRLGLIDLFLL